MYCTTHHNHIHELQLLHLLHLDSIFKANLRGQKVSNYMRQIPDRPDPQKCVELKVVHERTTYYPYSHYVLKEREAKHLKLWIVGTAPHITTTFMNFNHTSLASQLRFCIWKSQIAWLNISDDMKRFQSWSNSQKCVCRAERALNKTAYLILPHLTFWRRKAVSSRV